MPPGAWSVSGVPQVDPTSTSLKQGNHPDFCYVQMSTLIHPWIYWDILLANFINIIGVFESFYSITAERECDDYMFSQNFMINSMVQLSA